MSKHNGHSAIQSLKNWLAYLKGKLSDKESHAFEKRLLQDDFEAEAFEGLSQHNPEDLEADLQMLSHRLNTQSRSQSRTLNVYWRVAAILILLSAVTFTIFKLGFDNISQQSNLSKEEQTVGEEPVKKESANPAATDSASRLNEESIAMNYDKESSVTEPMAEEKTNENDVPNNAGRTSGTLAENNLAEDLNAGKDKQHEVPITFIQPVSPSEEEIEEKELMGTPDPYKLDRTEVGELPPSDQVSGRTEMDEYFDGKISVKPEIKSKRRARSQGSEETKEVTSISREPVTDQTERDDETSKSFSVREAQPIGGFDTLNKFITKNVDPLLKNTQESTQTVILNLHINEKGALTEVDVIESPGKKYEKDALKVINKWSGWIPGSIKGEAVASSIKVEVQY